MTTFSLDYKSSFFIISNILYYIWKYINFEPQFPDELLKHSTKIVAALQKRIRALGELNRDTKEVKLYVMADTTYGNCCVDEVGAAHANADCVIHYGHTCLSPLVDNLFSLFVLLGESCSSCNSKFLKAGACVSGRQHSLHSLFLEKLQLMFQVV